MYDVIIIGAGVSGAAAARELAKYQLKICVLEKEEDVCCGTSKANSAIVHAGFDAPVGSLMAKLNVLGNEKMEQLSKELDFPFVRNGSLVVGKNENEKEMLKELYERGIQNGVKGLKILEKEELHAMEPNLSQEVHTALYAPTGGIVCPFHLNIALAENAYVNGVEFYFETEVQKISRQEEGLRLQTSKGEFTTRYVVNAAGVYADVFHNMLSKKKIHITPRKGEYCLLDKKMGTHVTSTIFSLPDAYGKGVLVTPTVHGNLLLGPTAVDIEDKKGTNTTQEGLQRVLGKAAENVSDIPKGQIITSFAGLRAHEDGHEFIIQELEDVPGFVDCAGIESPGLTSAPAIGEMVAQIIKEKLMPQEKTDFISQRKGLTDPAKLSLEERNELIRREPAYGNIICRCEKITEGEILDAIRRPLGARSLDGIKRRTRAGMGRCQSGFCSPKVMEILAEQLNLDMEQISKAGSDSEIIKGGETK